MHPRVQLPLDSILVGKVHDHAPDGSHALLRSRYLAFYDLPGLGAARSNHLDQDPDEENNENIAEQITSAIYFPYIPGNFIPAILRAKLGLPICLNIFFICAY